MMTMNNNKKILIIDDDEDTRSIYVDVFKKNDFEVIEASDGVEGLDKATSEEGIDVIFTGIIMPRMDGFQMIEALKERTETANIPIFINSHLGREDDKKKSDELGVEGFIIRGVVSPAQAVRKILHQLDGEEYDLKIDPLDLDGQEFIKKFNFPEEFLCDNCGKALVINVRAEKDGFKGKIKCSGCGKVF